MPGVEEWRDGWYRRTLKLAGGGAVVGLRPGRAQIDCRLCLASPSDRDEAVARCRWLLDLDADPEAIAGKLGSDSHLAPLVRRVPGRRVPHTVDPAEMAVRAVLGQQVSTAAARTHTSRLVVAHGEPIEDPGGGLTHLFPTAAALTELDPGALALPRSRRTTLITLVQALGSGAVDFAQPRVRERLMELPGFGPWTVETIAMRALGDPDAFLVGDLGVVRAARALGLPTTPAALTAAAEAWRPYRAYAVPYLWATGDHAINRMPG